MRRFRTFEAVIAEALRGWFKEHEGDGEIWYRPVGMAIRECLEERGQFKQKGRGDPAKGRRVMEANKARAAVEDFADRRDES